ncbi:sodium:proton antiporter [Georgenia sp. AZ-5]|uniref:sodium:proton antiporter n=1 Tax=Georgenia sp. AZ-5 TaxID=3367526 RepID=UPI0037548E3C
MGGRAHRRRAGRLRRRSSGGGHRGEVGDRTPIRDAIILSAAVLAYRTTNQRLRTANGFTWGPIKRVAIIFVGIHPRHVDLLLVSCASSSLKKSSE